MHEKENIMKNTITEGYNKRAYQMWFQISQHICFHKASVVDLGCGGGDFLWRALMAGASNVLGVDSDIDKAKKYAGVYRIPNGKGVDKVVATVDVIEDDIEKKLKTWGGEIGFCFSVLPYLEAPTDFLRWMSEMYFASIVECQYDGDGPGLSFVKNRRDMQFWLSRDIGFSNIELIGSTYIAERDKFRDIWMCVP